MEEGRPPTFRLTAEQATFTEYSIVLNSPKPRLLNLGGEEAFPLVWPPELVQLSEVGFLLVE